MSGALSELLSRSVKYTDVVLANVSESIEARAGRASATLRDAPGSISSVVEAPGESKALKATVERALAVGATLYAGLTPRVCKRLEDRLRAQGGHVRQEGGLAPSQLRSGELVLSVFGGIAPAPDRVNRIGAHPSVSWNPLP